MKQERGGKERGLAKETERYRDRGEQRQSERKREWDRGREKAAVLHYLSL